jgi:electron transfer flavoprotein beta subunit
METFLDADESMKVLVPVKRVIDANIKVRVKADNSGVETANVKMAMNPFCEIAVEEAVRMKEAGTVEEVIAVTAGPSQCQESLRTALAMGADRAIMIETDEVLEPLGVAKLLKAVVDNEGPGMVIMGKQAIDGDNNQTGQMLSALLGWSQGAFTSKIEVAGDSVNIVREVDAGLQSLTLKMPAVVTVDLRLNEPRYASLPNIMKAKKKPMDTTTPADLGVDITPRVNVISVGEPPAREAGVIVPDVATLVDKLRNEAKVIS